MPRQRLITALNTRSTDRCADGCETTRALFAAAIERELAGEPPDQALYARLDACPACAQEYIAALDLAFSLDREAVRAAEAPPVALPLPLRLAQHRTTEDGGLRRVAEDSPPYDADPDP